MALEFKSVASFDPATELVAGDAVLFATTTPGVYKKASLSDIQTFVVKDVQQEIDDLQTNALPSVWPTARTVKLTGAVTGQVSVDGSQNVELATTIDDGSLSIAKTSGLSSQLLSLQNGVTAAVNKEVYPVGNGADTDFTITHTLATQALSATIINAATGAIEQAAVTITDAATVSVSFASAPAQDAYNVVLFG